MELKTVRVNKRELVCRNCETEFFGYTAPSDAAFTLYECSACSAIFSLAEGSTLDLGDQPCPDCDEFLEDTLQEKTQAGICPMCEDRDYYGTGNVEKAELETYAL